MQKPIESIVHFGKSFTQPIPSITNIYTNGTAEKMATKYSCAEKTLLIKSHINPKRKKGRLAKRIVLNVSVFFMSIPFFPLLTFLASAAGLLCTGRFLATSPSSGLQNISITYTSHRKRIRPVTWIIRHRVVLFIHPMRPCFPGAMRSGTPKHRSEINKVPASVEVFYTG